MHLNSKIVYNKGFFTDFFSRPVELVRGIPEFPPNREAGELSLGVPEQLGHRGRLHFNQTQECKAKGQKNVNPKEIVTLYD